jgi:hypothetical protein
MDNFIKDTYFESYGYDGVEFDGFLKRSPAKKQAAVQRKQAKTAARTAKKTAKIDRKAVRNDSRVQRKATKQAAKIEKKANRPRVMKVRAKIAEQEARSEERRVGKECY